MMFKKLLGSIFNKPEVALRGVDVNGIKYFSQTLPNGSERRWFKHPTDEPFPKNMPSEWYSWLHFRREEAPSPELSKRLQMVREQTRRNAQLWEEEMAQMELRDQVGGEGASRYHNQEQGFEFIAQQLNADADSTEETISHREPTLPHHPSSSSSTAATTSMSNVYPSENDPNVTLHNSSSIAGHGQPQTRGLAPKISADMAYHHSEVKAKNPSTMSQEELREMTRAYSKSRTSRFLGVKPQIRPNAFVNRTATDGSSATEQQQQTSTTTDKEKGPSHNNE